MLRKLTQQVSLVVLCSAIFSVSKLNAQDLPGRKPPSVTVVDPGITTAIRGKATNIDLFFRISQGFHVNSNKPRSEYLIPTTLRSEEHTSELQSRLHLVCRLLLEK